LKSLLNCNLKSEKARRNFYYFCQTIAPDFYRDDRPHLKTICDTLQALHEGRLTREDGFVYKKLMLNVPPQHGKSRTLVNFVTWCFGKNPNEKVITGAYNDSTASDFSRYTRDAIDAKAIVNDDIVYSDIFPKTKIKKGNAGFEKWALEGSHFSYLGVGIGGSVTSKGGSILIVDDPVKNAEDALNENNLERIWLWYTSTFQSRVSAESGEPLEIVCMTPWSKNDICGKILAGKNANDWYRISMPAYDVATDTMLCESLFGKKRYFDLKELIEPGIFNANYQMTPLDKSGVLFKRDELNTFSMSEFSKDGAESILGYIDVMDDGNDSLSFALGYVFKDKVFITDVVFTNDNIDITLPLCVGLIKQQDVYDDKKVLKQSFDYIRVEANNQGGGFIRLLRQHLPPEKILPVKNTQNKNTRVIMQYGFIKKHFYFRNDYERNSPYAKFMDELYGYMKDGSSKHDDAPDSIAGLSKFVQGLLPHLFV